MRIKSILAGTAIALALGLGTTSAADPFFTHDGVTAVAMSAGELDAVTGKVRHFTVTTRGAGLINPDTPAAATPLAGDLFRVGGPLNGGVAHGYSGLLVASDGVISIP